MSAKSKQGLATHRQEAALFKEGLLGNADSLLVLVVLCCARQDRLNPTEKQERRRGREIHEHVTDAELGISLGRLTQWSQMVCGSHSRHGFSPVNQTKPWMAVIDTVSREAFPKLTGKHWELSRSDYTTNKYYRAIR